MREVFEFDKSNDEARTWLSSKFDLFLSELEKDMPSFYLRYKRFFWRDMEDIVRFKRSNAMLKKEVFE